MRSGLAWGFLALVAIAVVAINVCVARWRQSLEERGQHEEDPETWFW